LRVTATDVADEFARANAKQTPDQMLSARTLESAGAGTQSKLEEAMLPLYIVPVC
jgi:hypothetical protein